MNVIMKQHATYVSIISFEKPWKFSKGKFAPCSIWKMRKDFSLYVPS